MPTREIPSPQWPSFLGNFGFRHFCWDATLEQTSQGCGRQVAVNHSFLEEVTTDVADGKQQINIVLGTPFRRFHTHVVSDPRRVRVVAGAQAVLEIESADGSKVVMRLRRHNRSI